MYADIRSQRLHSNLLQFRRPIRLPADGLLAFAARLSPIVPNGSNAVFSPLSIRVLLSLVAAGASASTAEQLLSFLKSDSVDDLNALSLRLFSEILTDPDEAGSKLSFGNGVWIHQGFSLKHSFEQDVYKADLHRYVLRPRKVSPIEAEKWPKYNGLGFGWIGYKTKISRLSLPYQEPHSVTHQFTVTMVAQTRSKNKNTSSSSAKIGVNVNPVPETSNKKTMKKARSKVNVADASQKARSKDIVNHNVADASKKEKKIKKKVEDGTGPVPEHCVNDMDFAFNIFLKDYMEECSLVCPVSSFQLECSLVHEARNCFDALSRKEKQSYKKKYMEMEDQQRKRIDKENRKRGYAYFGPLPKSFRFYSLQTFYDYL